MECVCPLVMSYSSCEPREAKYQHLCVVLHRMFVSFGYIFLSFLFVSCKQGELPRGGPGDHLLLHQAVLPQLCSQGDTPRCDVITATTGPKCRRQTNCVLPRHRVGLFDLQLNTCFEVFDLLKCLNEAPPREAGGLVRNATDRTNVLDEPRLIICSVIPNSYRPSVEMGTARSSSASGTREAIADYRCYIQARVPVEISGASDWGA